MKQFLLFIGILFTTFSIAQTASSWSLQTTPSDNNWNSITYGNGLFVAVSSDGTGNRIMTSPDGVTWTTRTSPANNSWNDVTYANGKFIAVASSGTDRVMQSTDGITWTTVMVPSKNWFSITYGNGLFIAVGGSGMGAFGDFMTSPDGVTWTASSRGFDVIWADIKYLNGNFIAVGYGTGGGNLITTSPDGTTWTGRDGASNAPWSGVAYGNGVYVVVGSAQLSSSPIIKTSTDCITWTTRRTGATNRAGYTCVTFGNGVFVALRGFNSVNNTHNKVSVSSDGINWTDYAAAANTKLWTSVTYSNEIFVGVSRFDGLGGAGNRVMTSGSFLNTNSFNQLETVSIYPNPTNAVLNFTTETNAQVEIYNLLGKVIANKNINTGESTIDISNFHNGMYIAKVTNDLNQTKTIKIIKQ